MATCPDCGRKLDAFNSTRFTERECVGVDYTGKKEYVTTSFTVCNECALFIASGIADGHARAKIAAIHKRRVESGDDAVPRFEKGNS